MNWNRLISFLFLHFKIDFLFLFVWFYVLKLILFVLSMILLRFLFLFHIFFVFILLKLLLSIIILNKFFFLNFYFVFLLDLLVLLVVLDEFLFLLNDIAAFLFFLFKLFLIIVSFFLFLNLDFMLFSRFNRFCLFFSLLLLRFSLFFSLLFFLLIFIRLNWLGFLNFIVFDDLLFLLSLHFPLWLFIFLFDWFIREINFNFLRFLEFLNFLFFNRFSFLFFFVIVDIWDSLIPRFLLHNELVFILLLLLIFHFFCNRRLLLFLDFNFLALLSFLLHDILVLLADQKIIGCLFFVRPSIDVFIRILWGLFLLVAWAHELISFSFKWFFILFLLSVNLVTLYFVIPFFWMTGDLFNHIFVAMLSDVLLLFGLNDDGLVTNISAYD